MAMTLDDVKLFLRVDDDADDALISEMMQTAEAFVVSAVGEFDDTNPKEALLYKSVVQEQYDHRELMQSNARQRMGYVYRSLILQIQLELEEQEEEDSNVSG
jgi:uncharacterized phage protein (predicted DNA packaging)